jgi:hypothetical protein
VRRDDPNNVPPQPPAPKTAVYVDPRVSAKVTNPAAMAYQKALQERRVTDPVGGAAAPPIPRLDSPHQDGMTMADQAQVMRQQAAQPPPGTIFTPEAAAERLSPKQGILQNDVLPEAARQDPAFREGHGSMYAVNQPNLALKYGVIRNGRPMAPQELDTGRAGLKSKTVEGLEAVVKFNQQRQSAEKGDTAAEKASEEGLAGQAAKLANPSGEGDAKPVTEEQKKEVESAMKNMDEFDFSAFREIMMKDLINNDEQRKIVEERLTQLDLSQLIVDGRCTQRVPIIVDKYEPTFQSFTGEEELSLKRLLMEERKGLETPDRYLLDKFQLMTIALGLTKVNQTALPTHQDENGHFDDKLFWAKFNRVMKLPFHMLASIGVHYFWFDTRVRKLFVAERLKNG